MPKKYDYDEYFSNLEVPETWETLEDFVDWYMRSKMPLRIPADSIISVTDNATAITTFKHKNYQVEMYIIHPASTIDFHYHPDMEVIQMLVGDTNGSLEKWGGAGVKTKPKMGHGNPEDQAGNGLVLMVFEKWLNNAPITSAAIQWKGPVPGPKQEALITKYYPNAVVRPYDRVNKVEGVDWDGWYDVTKKD